MLAAAAFAMFVMLRCRCCCARVTLDGAPARYAVARYYYTMMLKALAIHDIFALAVYALCFLMVYTCRCLRHTYALPLLQAGRTGGALHL